MFWTGEQRGEETSTWLLFAHKYAYLRDSAAKFVGAEIAPRRAFCIPPASAGASSRPERVLLLLAVALMESFGIRVDVCVEPEYTSVQGFAFDQQRQAIMANWVGPTAFVRSTRPTPDHCCASSPMSRATRRLTRS